MSLVAWYPLNGDLKNYAPGEFGDLENTATSVNTQTNDGKIGKTYTNTSNTSGTLLSKGKMLLGKNQSMFCWLYMTDVCSSSSLNAIMGQHRYNYNSGNGMNMGLTVKYVSSTTGYLSVNTATTYGRTYKTYRSSTLLSAGRWYHVGYTYDGSTICLYINGVLDKSYAFTEQVFAEDYFGAYMWSLNGATIGTRGPCNNYNMKGKLNDIRIYNHTLSKKEVKEISKGLILDYNFENDYLENMTNYVPYPTPGSSAKNQAWDQTLHAEAIYVSGWHTGYNSGVEIPATGYHAMWQLIDGLPTIVLKNLNEQFSLKQRWMGTYCRGIPQASYTADKKYTISFDARADVEGMTVHGGMYYSNSSTISDFHDGQYISSLTKTWKRYSKTFTVKYTAESGSYNGPLLYVYGHGTSIEGTSYVRNIQFEFNDHATPYKQSSRAISVIDNSGYGHTGTPYALVSSSTTNLGLKSAYFNGSTSYIQIPHFKNDLVSSPFTFSFWVNPSESATQDIYFGDYSSTGQIQFNIERNTSNQLRVYFAGDSLVGAISAFTIPASSWTHVCLTYDGTTFKAYKNGTSVYSKAISSTLVKTSGYWKIGSDYRTADATSEATRYKGYLSDFKIYATALSATDVSDMYKTRIQIARDGSLFVNNTNEIGDILTNGTNNKTEAKAVVFDSKMNTNVNGISEYDIKNKFDGNVYFEPDGSAWVRIVHHNNPASAVFSNTNDFATSCYIDANRWFNGEVLNYLNSWELLIKQKLTTSSEEIKYRWIQTKNPMNAAYADVASSSITKITSNGYTTFAHGGLYKHNSNTYLCTNNGTSGNWWGAVGLWTQYAGGIPAWARGVVTTGYCDLYVRIDDAIPETDPGTNFKSFNQGTVYAKNIIEY